MRLLVVAASLLALSACDPNAGAYKPTAAAPALWDPRAPDVDPMDVASWHAAGVATMDIPGWKVLGASPEEAAPLAAAGASSDQVQPFIDAGISLSDRPATRWGRQLLTQRAEWVRHRRAHTKQI